MCVKTLFESIYYQIFDVDEKFGHIIRHLNVVFVVIATVS